MAWRPSKTRTFPIGVDPGTAVVKMVQVRSVEGRLELLAAVSTDVPQDCRANPNKRMQFLGEHLSGPLRSGGFKGRKCVLSLPAAETFVLHVKTPKLSARDLGPVLRLELMGKLPCNPDDAVLRHVVAGETFSQSRPGLEVIVMGAPRKVVAKYLAMARRNKLEVTGLSLEPCAIIQCFGRLFRRGGDDHRVTLFLDVGQACTQVVIAHGAKLVFARNLMVGAEHLDAAAAGATGLSVEQVRAARRESTGAGTPEAQVDRIYQAMDATLDCIGREIARCLQYHESVFPARAVERAIFLGGPALDRRLCQRMAQHVNLPAQIGDPLAQIKAGAHADPDRGVDRRLAQPAWAVAVGLSLGAQLPEAA